MEIETRKVDWTGDLTVSKGDLDLRNVVAALGLKDGDRVIATLKVVREQDDRDDWDD